MFRKLNPLVTIIVVLSAPFLICSCENDSYKNLTKKEVDYIKKTKRELKTEDRSPVKRKKLSE